MAIAAAPAAMPVNPKSAATIAIIKKIMAQRNILSPPQKGIESGHFDARDHFCGLELVALASVERASASATTIAPSW